MGAENRIEYRIVSRRLNGSVEPLHPGSQWEVMSNGFYAVEFGRDKTAIQIPKGSLLMQLKCGDPDRVRFSFARRRYWTFTTQFHSCYESRSKRGGT